MIKLVKTNKLCGDIVNHLFKNSFFDDLVEKNKMLRKKAFSNILISASFLNIILSFIFVPLFKHIGSAISVTIVETFVTLAMFSYLQLTGLPMIEFKRRK